MAREKLRQTLILFTLAILSISPALAQSLTVTGSVTDVQDGEPLIGATVAVKGKPGVGTSVDIDGNYSIKVDKGAVLVYSYMGYTTQERKVTGGVIDVAMTAETNLLDDVVVIGYGTAKKSDLTGAVSSVSGTKLAGQATPSLANALQGQAAGVQVNSSTGRPGAAAEVRIRGVGTVNNSAPIYVVDGVITEDISFLSPNDIDHTEILKDASATAIYGSRGANGVIIVTTRAGKKNQKARITFDAYLGFQQRWRKLDVMDSKSYADAYVSIFGNASAQKYYAEHGLNGWLNLFSGLRSSDYYPTVYDPDKNPDGFDYSKVNTDWQDEVFRNGMMQNYHLSVDGGTDKLTYSMSGGWFGQQGTIIGSGYSRFSGRLNTSYQALPWLKIGENISFSSSILKNVFENGDNSESAGANILAAAFSMAPWDPTYYTAGYKNKSGVDLGGRPAAGSNFKNVINPMSMVDYYHPKVRNERWVGNVFMDINPISHLTLHSAFNFDYCLSTNKSFSEAYEVSAYDRREKNFLSSSMSRSFYWNVDNILTYAREFGLHDLSVMVGNSIEEYNYYSIGNSGSSILNPEERNWYLSQVTEDYGTPSDAVARNRRVSWLGRVQYSFDSRYLLTVNFRADGSSKFAEHPWGYFPSFAAAWRLSREKFMQDFSNLDDLKIRFGWGKVGNDKIGDDAFVQNVGYSSNVFYGYPFGNPGILNQGAAVLTWINKGGHWENTEQWSVGVDAAFFGRRLIATVDGFIRKTNDMLMSVNSPAYVGNLYDCMANVGQVTNKGVEITLEHSNNVGKDFYYSVNGNITFIKNELTKLNGGSPLRYDHDILVINEGQPIRYFWGYDYLGVFQSDEQVLDMYHGYNSLTTPYHAGDAIYRDVNSDGVIDDADRIKLGSSIPTVSYGLTLTAGWRGLDLSLFFQGQTGNKIYNYKRMYLEGLGAESIFSPEMADAWTPQNTTGSIPNPRNSVNYFISDRFLESGAYMRLKNLTLGYTLPKTIFGKSGFSNVRFYAQISNLFTVTKYKGYDPEIGSGVDYGNYPQSRTFLFGVNITY